jgi:hypothetical protein
VTIVKLASDMEQHFRRKVSDYWKLHRTSKIAMSGSMIDPSIGGFSENQDWPDGQYKRLSCTEDETQLWGRGSQER